MFENLNFWQAIKIGGPVMYVLLLCSVISIAVILERLLYYYRRSQVKRADFMQSIRQQLSKNDLKAATEVAQKAATPFAAVVLAGLSLSHPDEKELTETMQRQVLIEAGALENRTAIVGTIGSTAVYIGLLGTVFGIIHTFRYISTAGFSGINVVIGGIAEALVCTAAGLFVAIPAVVTYNYFQKRVGAFVIDMELCASELAGLLRAQKNSK